jgi:ferredoxin-type protein NapH
MKTRQKVRRGILIASLALFPVTFYWLSPYLSLQGASEGVFSGSLIVFAVLFLSSLALGRLFCGWVCPAAGLQELTALARGRRVNRFRIRWIKYLIWIPWLSALVFFFLKAGGVQRVDPLYMTWNGISVTDLQGAFTAAIVLVVMFLPALIVGRRATCHTICWMAPFMILGRSARNLIGWPSLRLASDKPKCTSCMRCVKGCPMSIEVRDLVQRGSLETTDCILCGTCVDGCDQGAIRYQWGAGRLKNPGSSRLPPGTRP